MSRKAVGKCVWCDRRISRPKGICERCGPYLVRQAREALAREGFCPGCAEIIIAAVKEARSKKRRGP